MRKVLNLLKIFLLLALVTIFFSCSGGANTKPKESITVTYEYNYEDCPEAVEVKQYKGEAFSLKVLEREGYILLGYTDDPEDDPESTEVAYKLEKKTSFTEDVTLYAKWIEEGARIYVTFNSYDESDNIAVQEAFAGVPFKLKNDPLTKKGFTLICWTDASGETEYINGEEVTFNQSVNLYAVWKNNYDLGKVILHSNYGKDKTKELYFEKNNTKRQQLADGIFERDGYRLIGWSIDPSAGPSSSVYYNENTINPGYYWQEQSEDEEPMVLNYYAVWQSSTEYTITFYSDKENTYGEPVKKIITTDTTETYNFNLLEQDMFKRDGYVIVGWQDSPVSLLASKTYNGQNFSCYGYDRVLYAIWEPENSAITFTYHKNDEFAGTDKEETLKVYYKRSYGSMIGNPFEREGYEFYRWGKGGTTSYYYYKEHGSAYATEDVDVYAIWKKFEPVVTYDYNVEGVEYENQTETLVMDEYMSIHLPEYTREHYSLMGWSETKDGEIKFEFDYRYPSLQIDNDTTLYAVWEKNPVITIHPNYEGAEQDAFSFEISKNKDYNLIQDPEFTREGYVYKQANTVSDGTGKNYTINQSWNITEDIDLYIVWEAPLTITYYANYPGGNEPDKAVVKNHAKDSTPIGIENPFGEVEGYTFAGWAETSDGKATGWGQPGQTYHYSITEDLVRYAEWVADRKLTFYSNYDGNGEKSVTKEIILPYNTEYEFVEFDEFKTPENTKFMGYGSRYDSTPRRNYSSYYPIGDKFIIDRNNHEFYCIYKAPLIITYYTNYDAKGGTTETYAETTVEESFEYDEPIILSDLPEGWAHPDVEGEYKFLGWNNYYRDGELFMEYPGDKYETNYSTNFYAVWSQKKVLTYHSAEDDEVPEIQKTYRDEPYTIPDYFWDYDEETADFLGWSTTKNSTYVTYTKLRETKMEYSRDLYPVFRKKPVITYHANYEGSEEPDHTQIFEYDTYTQLDECLFTNGNKRFIGWSKTPENSSYDYAANKSIKLTSDLDLYAMWKNQPVITYHADYDGAEQEDYTQDAIYDEEITLIPNRFTREGYVFYGWATSAGSTYKYYSDCESITPTTDKNLYAVWRKLEVPLIIHQNYEGADPEVNTILVAKNIEYKVSKDWVDERDGYMLKGYSTSATSSSITYKLDSNYYFNFETEIYALWSTYYTITFNANYVEEGAEEAETTTQLAPETEESILNLCPFTRDGYSFYGWSTSEKSKIRNYKNGDKIKPTKDITLYAIWRKN